jgi:hypothetical protein
MISPSARSTRLQARIKVKLRQNRRREEKWRSVLQETPAVKKPDNEVMINMSQCTHRRNVM